MSSEVPQDFLASSEAEDAAVATANGISLAPYSLEEEVAQLMAQELPYTVFDADTEVAVASVLNAKLEFDEALLNENVALGGMGEGEVQDEEMQMESEEHGSADTDASRYLKFSRTVVNCEASKDSEHTGLPQPPATHSISQLDGADGGSESDGSEAVEDDAQHTSSETGEAIQANQNTPTKKLTVALKRLESVFTETKSATDQETTSACETGSKAVSSSPHVLEACDSNNGLSVREEVLMDSETTASEKDVLLDPATGHFISADDGTVVYLANNKDIDKDDTSSSSNSYYDDLGDPDYSPEPQPKKAATPQVKTIIIKPIQKRTPTTNVRRISPKTPPSQQSKYPKVPLPLRPAQTINITSVSASPSTVSTVPRTVTSPIVINGLSSLPLQPGATRARPIAIRLDPKPRTQQLVICTQAGASKTSASLSPSTSPQVLLVNRLGQILIKNPGSNTYQPLNTNSPSYSRISQIAKMLHSSNAMPRPVPRLLIPPSPSIGTNAIPTSKHTLASAGKVIIKAVSVNSGEMFSGIRVKNVSELETPNYQGGAAQAIIDRAMASHREMTRTQPIILGCNKRTEPRILSPSPFQVPRFLEMHQSPSAVTPSGHLNDPSADASTSSRSQVRVKRVSSVSERPGRKRCRTDFLRDPTPSSELDELDESRYGKVSYYQVFYVFLYYRRIFL